MQYTAKQKRRIDRRQLAAEEPLPAIDVNEVVEKTVLVRTFFEEKSQCLLHPLLAIDGAEVIIFGGNAQRTQSKAGRRNARDPAERSSDDRRPVPHQTAPGTRFIEEEIRIPARHVVQQGIRRFGDLGKRPVDEDAWRVSVLLRRLALRLWGSSSSRRCSLLILQRLAGG